MWSFLQPGFLSGIQGCKGVERCTGRFWQVYLIIWTWNTLCMDRVAMQVKYGSENLSAWWQTCSLIGASCLFGQSHDGWKSGLLRYGLSMPTKKRLDCGRWDAKAILQSQYFLSCAFLHCLWRLFCSTRTSTRSYKVRKMRRRTRETYSKTETCRYESRIQCCDLCGGVHATHVFFQKCIDNWAISGSIVIWKGILWLVRNSMMVHVLLFFW